MKSPALILSLLLFLIVILIPARSNALKESGMTLPANVEFLETRGAFSKYRLKSNGMPIYLSSNHAAPVITFMVVYHVGSRNEAPGNTGSAHLLEHMLFNKSTENFGKEHGHQTFQEVLHEAGADFSSTNMTTWNDRMNGYSTLPSDKLEIAMKIEADRLGRGLILDKERQPEMSVVRNEYEIGENDPSQALLKSVIGAAIVAHPYHWDTIGYRSDIEGVSTEKLREHYKNFFWPNNAEAILVGDFDTAGALAIFDREFGGFPASTNPIPAVITVEPPQEGERRVVVKRPGQVGIVQAAYIRPGALDPDFVPLDVLSTVLGGGINSRLYQALVETKIASSVNAYNFTLHDPYPILFEAVLAPDSTHQKAEDTLKATLYDVAKNGVTSEEVKRAEKQIEVQVIRSRDGTYNLTSSLGEAIASANWEWWDNYLNAMNSVTAADVKRVAAKYLVPDHATIGWFVPAEAPAEKENTTASASEAPATTEASPTPSASAAKGSPSPAPQPASAANGSQTFAKRTLHRVLKNGIILDVVENHAVPTVALQMTILAGNMTAPAGKPALPRLTASMLERGTKTKDKRAIAEALDNAGAQLEFSASLYEATAIGTGLSRDTNLLLQTLADEIRNPAFSQDELEKAKAELKTTALQEADNTSLRAGDRLSEIVFPQGHPYHAPTLDEMTASIAAATREDVVAFHHDMYNGSSMILAIVGDVKAAEVATMVDKLLGDVAAGKRKAYSQPRTQPAAPVREVVTMRGKANMNLIYGAASELTRTDPDFEAALIANAAVGQDAMSSRIGKRVRDTEGLSYSLASRFRMSDYLDGVWLVNVAVAPSNLQKALASTKDEFEKYCREGITDEEVETQKNFFAGNYQVRLGSNGGIAAALAEAEKFGYGPGYLDDFPKRIRNVTREQANAAIKTHMHPDKLNLIVAGDLDKLPE